METITRIFKTHTHSHSDTPHTHTTHQEVALVVWDEQVLGGGVVAQQGGDILSVHEVLEASDVDAPSLLQKSWCEGKFVRES